MLKKNFRNYEKSQHPENKAFFSFSWMSFSMLVVPKPPLSWNKRNLETRLAFGFDLCFSVTSAGLSYAYETILQYHSSIWNCYDKCYSRIGDPCWATLHNDWHGENSIIVLSLSCSVRETNLQWSKRWVHWKAFPSVFHKWLFFFLFGSF